MKALDLFCEAGGFSKGFESANLNVKYGIDSNEQAIKTYNQNHEGLEYDIRKDDIPDEIQTEDFDLFFGSPPCQGFSDARGSRYLNSDENGLVFEFTRWVDEIQPELVLMENVTGIKTISDDFIKGLK